MICGFIPPYLSKHPEDSLVRAHRETMQAQGIAAVPSGAAVSVWDLSNRPSSHAPGRLAWVEGQDPTPQDTDVNEAAHFLMQGRSFLDEIYGWNSFDNNGADITGVVHLGRDVKNAFWDGMYMLFGDGFTKSLEIVIHELSHAVTQHTSRLVYQRESGSINEAFSDIMGAIAVQRLYQQNVSEADWLVGNELDFFGNGSAIRSMSAPGTAYEGDPQPDHYAKRYRGTDDNGGVHINSGIINRWFYEYARRISDRTEARSWDEPIADVAWSLTSLSSTATFKDASAVTCATAQRRFSFGNECEDAWEVVGL